MILLALPLMAHKCATAPKPENACVMGVFGTKPVIITEFGPPGVWEIAMTSFGAPPELTSTEKAAVYREAAATILQGPVRVSLHFTHPNVAIDV